jgi:6-pyruvoyltetrahydropterin/6-carboxytetrahydropterin synthase
MIITKEIEIDMGHRIPNHTSKCANPHGHRYKIEAGVNGAVSDSTGMIIDFGDLKQIMKDEIELKFDHGFVIADNDDLMLKAFSNLMNFNIIIVPFIPTAENLCKHFYNLIKPRLKDKGISLSYVRVWETPTSTAYYKE